MNHSLAIELLAKVLCDVNPEEPTAGAYLFAQTLDNQSSVFKAGRDLLAAGATVALLIPDSEPRCGYPGFEQWSVSLQESGVAAELVCGVPTADFDSLNTYTEALAAVRFARAQGFTSLHVVAAPFHQMRAFISAVSAALFENSGLQIYNAVGETLPWYEKVAHSQGSLLGSRQEFIHTELERIERYTEKGDLLPLPKILEYLRQRDGEGLTKDR